MIKMTDIVKKIIKDHRPSYGTAVDMTVGNGYDTLFLASVAERVYGFDIQSEALETAKKRLQEHNITHCRLIEDGHEHIDRHIDEEIDLAIYNLGYLPGGDKTLTTHSETTILSLDRLLPKLARDALVLLVVYQGHDAGEKNALSAYFETLPVSGYDVFSFSSLNTQKAPLIIGAVKK